MNSPLSSWSLLNRLTLGVVLLSTLGFVASDIAAQSLLRNFLTHEVDNELLSIAGGSIPRFGNKHTLVTVHDVQWID